MTQEIAVTSVDYARSLVTYQIGSTFPNPTSLPVQMGFSLSPVSPPLITYVNATWETSTSPPYYVICLIGVGATVLAVGYYYKWIRLTNTPQIPAFRAGTLRIIP